MPKISDKKTIAFIVGTRPEIIKMAPLILYFQKQSTFNTKVILSGQHTHLAEQALLTFNIQPDIILKINREKNDTLSELTAQLFLKLEPITKQKEIDWVFVHGDTTTSYVATLTAFYNNKKTAHIEAGLRTEKKLSPFPEEANRRMIAQIAELHFCPTIQDKENIKENSIFVTGNTIIDSLEFVNNLSSHEKQKKKNPLIIVTCHRREKDSLSLHRICSALNTISEKIINISIVFIKPANKEKLTIINKLCKNNKNIKIIPPLPYADFINLLSKCSLIITDSGGIQEEAFFLNKPALILREETERPFVLNSFIQLCGSNTNQILDQFQTLISAPHPSEKLIMNEKSPTEKILENFNNYIKSKEIL